MIQKLGPRPEAVLQEVAPLRDRLFDHYRHDHFELFDRMPTGIRPWDVAHVWHTEPPEHLRGLAQWLKACVPAAGWDAAAARCAFISRPRDQLFRPQLAARVTRDLETTGTDPEALQLLVLTLVAAGRRDTRCADLPNPVAGFAVTPQGSLVLCKNLTSGRLQALFEGSPSPAQLERWGIPDGQPIRRGFDVLGTSATHLDIDTKRGPVRLSGAVHLQR